MEGEIKNPEAEEVLHLTQEERELSSTILQKLADVTMVEVRVFLASVPNKQMANNLLDNLNTLERKKDTSEFEEELISMARVVVYHELSDEEK